MKLAEIPSSKSIAALYNFGEALQRPLSAFHRRFVQSWDDLPQNSRLKEAAIRIATIIVAPAFYFVLGVVAITGKIAAAIGLRQHILLSANELSQHLAVLRKSGKEGWQQEAVALVRKFRYQDPSAEIKRIQATRVLTDTLSARLDSAINQVNPFLSKKRFNQIKMIMAQALELKSIYGDTHHVFIHAQASNWLGLTYLVKELHKAFEPDTQVKHFKFLRPPIKLAKPGMASSLWKAFRNTFLEEAKITNVREYIHSKWFVMDSDGETREHLLSVDGYFLNPQRYESSLFFLVNNSNILGKSDTIKYFYKQIVNHYNPDLSEKTLNKLVNRVFHAVQSEKAPCGNLFTICVPKEKSRDIQYRAHPFGVVCKCHSEEESGIILNNLQKESLTPNTKCSSSIKIPQFRIYTPMLKPGITPTYLLTPHDRADRRNMKAKIKKAVLEARFASKSGKSGYAHCE